MFTSIVASLLLVVVMATPSTLAAEDPGGQLLSRAFNVPPNFLTSKGALGKSGAMAVLKAGGIAFPEGASATFNPATSKLIVKNTKENLEAVDALLNIQMKRSPASSAADAAVQALIPKGLPLSATVSVQGYEISKKDPLVAQAQAAGADAKASLQKLGALVTRGQAKAVALPTLSARSGQRASIGNGSTTLEITPIIGPDSVRVSVTGELRQGTQSLPINTLIPFGGAAFVGAQEKGGGKDVVELVFLKVSAQPAGSAPDPTPSAKSESPPQEPKAAETKGGPASPAAAANPSPEGTQPRMGGLDALALIDPTKHAQAKSVWNRTANGIEWQANGHSPPYAGTFVLPVELAPSYAVEVEFTCGAPRENIGITVPVGGNRVTTCWFCGNGYAGIGKIDGEDPRNASIPGTASSFVMKPGERHTARVEVRHGTEEVDVQFLVEGKPLAAYRGPASRLNYSTMWLIGGERKHILLGAGNISTFHRATMKPLDDLKADDKTTPPTPAHAAPSPAKP